MTAFPVQRSTIIVNWNAGPSLSACLASVASEAADGQEVIVVDNASTDGSLEAAIATRPWVRVVRHATNLGFAAGANGGAAVARGGVLVFLNPDAIAEPGAVVTLSTAVTPPGDATVAGGGLCDLEGRWQPGAARFGPLGHLLLDTALGRCLNRQRRAPYVVDWVYGTFLAIRAATFRQLDGFDPRYFCYGEDLDLCYRVHRAGGAVRHVPAARARHGRNVSAVQRFGARRDVEVVHGELRFYTWRWGPWAARRYRMLAAVKYLLKAGWQDVQRQPAAAAVSREIVASCRHFRVDDGRESR